MRQVLFVDDEPMILEGLKRLLRPVRDRWEMHFESDAAQALARIEQNRYDVVVSDMRMPSFTGVDVLRHAKQHCPEAVRIGLSGHADAQLALEAARVTHQFLAKPCDAAQLIGTVDRIVRLQDRLNNEALRRHVTGPSSLPSLPSLYLRITREAAAPNGSLESVGDLIGQDLAMTAKVLQLVNSAYFGLRSEVASARQAATILGLDAIRAIVLTVELFESFDAGAEADDLERLRQHSVATGGIARRIAEHLGLDRHTADQALLGGMLHDVGKLIEISRIQRAYRLVQGLVQKAGIPETEAEEQLLGCTHADLGAYLLTLWGFPTPVVEAVLYHHRPGESPDREASALTAVHIANALDAHATGRAAARLDERYLHRLGLPAQVPAWLAALDTEPTRDIAETDHG